MNLWKCEHPGCGREVVGMGGGIGLRAIGWYFKAGIAGSPIVIAIGPEGPNLTGPWVFCPAHRPDAGPCTDAETLKSGESPEKCWVCTSQAAANEIQAWLTGMVEQIDAIRKNEREACAELASRPCTKGTCGDGEYGCHRNIATAIRARGGQ